MCEPVERVRVPRQAKDTEVVLAEFEKRLRRLEALAEVNGGPSDHRHSISSILSPTETKRELESLRGDSILGTPAISRRHDISDLRHGAGDGGRNSDEHDHDCDGELIEDTLGRPRYDLGSAARPVYHGELSMFDDSGMRPTAPTSPRFDSSSPTTWTEERLRAAARLRHRYATAEEAEGWMDTYFAWSSPVYSVVHRPLFIREDEAQWKLTSRRHGTGRPLLL